MHIVRRLYLPLLILLCAFWAFTPLGGGDDFWAHAAIGRLFLETGQVPRSTVYLWSAHIPWVFHAYGSGIIYAFLLGLGGPKWGPWICLCLNFALAITPLLLVWNYAKKRAGQVPLLLVCLFVPALWVSSVRWRLRPEGFTALFLTITLLFLASSKRPRWQYVGMVALFVLWPNLHGGVIAGMMMMWAGALAEIIQPLFSPRPEPLAIDGSLEGYEGGTLAAPTPRPRPDLGLLLLAPICSIVPLLCNPWGLGYRTVFAGTAATSNHIAEWRPFWIYPQMNREVAWALCALLVFALVVWGLDRQKRVFVGAALLVMGGLWIQARRQMWLTSLACMVALAQSAPLLSGTRIYAFLKRQRDAVPDGPMRIIGQVSVLIILICACAVNFPTKGVRAVDPTAPIAMSQFLLTKAPKGRTFNDYEYSAALEWFMGNKRPLYIDLINAYPPGLFDEWYTVAHADDKGLAVLDSKKIDVVALRPIDKGLNPTTKKPADQIYGLGQYLDSSPYWKQIYNGPDGHVWARRKLFNAPAVFDPRDKALNSYNK